MTFDVSEILMIFLIIDECDLGQYDFLRKAQPSIMSPTKNKFSDLF
jgi:hypothetical protein